jgi:hypothetical protein
MSDYLLFDLETVRNDSLLENLKVAFDLNPDESVEDIDLKKMTVDDVKQFIEARNPDITWLYIHYEMETGGKNRKGVKDALMSRIALLEDPVPDKWKSTPELQEIVTIGMADGPDDEIEVLQYEGDDVTGDEYDEWITESLTTLQERRGSRKLCGWNITGFDIPIIMMASTAYGVDCPNYKVHSFSGVEHNMLDLMKARWGRDWRKLRESALAVGMPSFEDAEDELVTGSRVAEAFANGEYDLIKGHCQVDLRRLQHLFHAYEGLFF